MYDENERKLARRKISRKKRKAALLITRSQPASAKQVRRVEELVEALGDDLSQTLLPSVCSVTKVTDMTKGEAGTYINRLQKTLAQALAVDQAAK